MTTFSDFVFTLAYSWTGEHFMDWGRLKHFSGGEGLDKAKREGKNYSPHGFEHIFVIIGGD